MALEQFNQAAEGPPTATALKAEIEKVAGGDCEAGKGYGRPPAGVSGLTLSPSKQKSF